MGAVIDAETGVVFDEYGLMRDPDQWTESVARRIAEREGVGPLGESHWLVIRSLRAHFLEFGTAPATPHLCRAKGHDPGWVHELFGSCLNAWRVAGLPDPGEEAKSYMDAG